MSEKKILYLAIFVAFFLLGCDRTDSKRIVNNSVEKLSDTEREYLVDMGGAGQGWAFEILASDAKDRGLQKDSQIWSAKALKAGDSLTLIEQAERLLSNAHRTENAFAKKILLDEARRLAILAIKNSYNYPSELPEDKGDLHVQMSSDLVRRIDSE